jgi:hypothetical protein
VPFVNPDPPVPGFAGPPPPQATRKARAATAANRARFFFKRNSFEGCLERAL